MASNSSSAVANRCAHVEITAENAELPDEFESFDELNSCLEAAIEVLNGQMLCGLPVKVRKGVFRVAESSSALINSNTGEAEMAVNSIYIRFSALRVHK